MRFVARLPSMRVTVFRVEDELGLLSLPQHGESAFCLADATFGVQNSSSTSEELAAAMAYRRENLGMISKSKRRCHQTVVTSFVAIGPL